MVLLTLDYCVKWTAYVMTMLVTRAKVVHGMYRNYPILVIPSMFLVLSLYVLYTYMTTNTRVITQLWIYPIKSCGGCSMKELRFFGAGFSFDRTFAIVNVETNTVLTQRLVPKMSLIMPKIDTYGAFMEISYDGIAADDDKSPGTLKLPLGESNIIKRIRVEHRLRAAQNENEKMDMNRIVKEEVVKDDISSSTDDLKDLVLHSIRIWNDVVTCIDCGDTAAGWIEKAIGGGGAYRMVFLSAANRRSTSIPVFENRDYDDQIKNLSKEKFGSVALADKSPILLCSEESLSALNAHIESKREQNVASAHVSDGSGANSNSDKSVMLPEDIGPYPVDMCRFRPNIVISGGYAWEEDSWLLVSFPCTSPSAFSASLATNFYCQPCARCTIPRIIPELGLRDPFYNEPMESLMEIHSGNDIGVTNNKKKSKQVCVYVYCSSY